MRASGRLPLPAVPGVRGRYFAAAVLLTLAWLLARSLAPAGGLTRSFHYPLAPDARPRALSLRDARGLEPAFEETTAAVDLAFLEEPGRPVRNYLVRWRGVWYSPRAERIELRLGADDGALVRVDGELLLERHPAVGMDTAARSIELAAGAHTLAIDHWQRGGARRLDVQWARAGRAPAPLDAGRLFPVDPGAPGYWLRAAAERLRVPLALVWAGWAALVLGGLVRRRMAMLTAAEAGARLRAAAFPALLGPSQVLLFGPWTVHATNRAEFLVPFRSLAPPGLGLLALAGALLAAFGLLLPPRAFRRYVAGLAAAGVLLWVQGNLLVADYGLLDGGGLDLGVPGWRVAVEIGLWSGGLALALAFAGAASRAAPTASGLLVALQAAVLILPPLAPAAARPESGDAASSWRLPPREIFELSARRNVIHIVLDMFPSNLFAEIRDADRPAFDGAWSGFTFFRDHLGAFASTKASMPAMLTGAVWRNETSLDSFAGRRPTVFHALGREGWRLRSLTSYAADHPSARFPGAESAVRYTIPSPYGTYRDYVDGAAAQLLDLSLFRHAPHGAKGAVYREGRWLVQPWRAPPAAATASDSRPLGDAAFLGEFAARIAGRGDDPVYTFLHVITPHPPFVTDAECAYTGRSLRLTAANYRAQARCALRAVEALLDRLRDLDLYDRSAIVVTSDHGTTIFPRGPNPLGSITAPPGIPLHVVELFATPLLLVKPFGARGPLRTSHAPTAIADLPATVLDLAGLPNTLAVGTPALALDPAQPRPRTFAYHSWGPGSPNTPGSRWFDVLHLFSVAGRVTDAAAWRYRRAIFAPARDLAAQRRAHRVGLWEDDGAAGSAGSAGSASSASSASSACSASSAGSAASAGPTYWTAGYAAFFVPAATGRVAFDVRRAPGLGAQTVTVRIDGEVVGRHRLAADAWRRLEYSVPPRDAANSPFCVEIEVSPTWRGADDRPRGVLLRGDL